MKSADKIAFMHDYYGVCDEHKCKECDHFERWQAGNKRVRKCNVYGVTSSVATDWNASFAACGAFNRDVTEKNLFVHFGNLRRSGKWIDRKMPGEAQVQVSLFSNTLPR